MQKTNYSIKEPMGAVLKWWKRQPDYNVRYKREECVLFRLFKDAPSNLSDILLRVVFLNGAYSTQIRNKNASIVAKLICDEKFDKQIREGKKDEVSVVNKLAKRIKTETDIRSYSFATKYCSFCKPDVYPIFDKYVINQLSLFNKKHEFSKFTKKEIREDYVKFCEVIDDFREFYGCEKEGITLKKMDKFFWVAGKEGWEFLFEGEKIIAKR